MKNTSFSIALLALVATRNLGWLMEELLQILDNLIAQGKAKPMIVVMPSRDVVQDAGYGYGKMVLQATILLLINEWGLWS